MELVELLSQTRVTRDDRLGRRGKSFIFNKALLPGSPKLHMVTSTAFVSLGYSGF
jgi:hypothetical protein